MNHTTSSTHVDFHAFIHPASAYGRPDEVLRDPALSTAEKRVILSSWASDAHTVESQPWLRQLPGADHPVTLAAILDALRRLDDDDPPKGGMAIRVCDLKRATMPPVDCLAKPRSRTVIGGADGLSPGSRRFRSRALSARQRANAARGRTAAASG